VTRVGARRHRRGGSTRARPTRATDASERARPMSGAMFARATRAETTMRARARAMNPVTSRRPMTRLARRAGTVATRATETAAAMENGSSSAMPEEARARREAAKRRLVEACAGTYRGALATREDKEEISAAQGALERTVGDEALDFDALDGKWRLVYTNAADVLGLLVASQRLGVPEVGDIFQSFGCANGANTGITNEIRLSLPFLLSEAKTGAPGGVGLRVQASFRDLGKRRLALTFQEARVSEVSISPLAETLLAPAILPRSSLNHQILMAIKELELKFPLRGALTSMGGGDEGAAVGSYHLTYCDEDVLVGRAAAGGVYIFTRA